MKQLYVPSRSNLEKMKQTAISGTTYITAMSVRIRSKETEEMEQMPRLWN